MDDPRCSLRLFQCLYESSNEHITCRISSLDHEVLDQPMEDGIVILPFCAQSQKVLGCPRNEIAVDLQIESPETRDQLDISLLLHAPNSVVATLLDLFICGEIVLILHLQLTICSENYGDCRRCERGRICI